MFRYSKTEDIEVIVWPAVVLVLGVVVLTALVRRKRGTAHQPAP